MEIKRLQELETKSSFEAWILQESSKAEVKEDLTTLVMKEVELNGRNLNTESRQEMAKRIAADVLKKKEQLLLVNMENEVLSEVSNKMFPQQTTKAKQ
jgi:hypothetical protein